ncbi:MAG TPA: hypothetical protein PLD10_20355, partial [Rhodopila sp.]|nr:hypothetical protein [Rhodopila sp.]
MTDEAGINTPSHPPGQAQGAAPTESSQPARQSEPRHTAQGAPTDAAHQDAGDGALTGSVPA